MEARVQHGLNPRAPANGLFAPASEGTLELIRTLNQQQRCTFLIPTKFVSAEAAQVGCLLNEHLNSGRSRNQRTSYRTFFANSRYEALQGAVKVARHGVSGLFRRRSRSVFVLDPSDRLEPFFDPLSRGEKEALVPGLRFLHSVPMLSRALGRGEPPAAVVVPADGSPGEDAIGALFRSCAQRRVLTVLDASWRHSGLALAGRLRPAPDVVVTGESLTDLEIPFAALSMSERAYAPWNRLDTCLLHSSTYGGNRLALAKARDVLTAALPPTPSAASVLAECRTIAQDPRERVAAFARYVNPGMIRLYTLLGFETDPVAAHGSHLVLRHGDQEEEVLDFVAGAGAVARGHTPDDLVPDVIDEHDPTQDYWQHLSHELGCLSGLPHALPAVSGATAVELGIILSMLAGEGRTRIVTFSGNYAGKTLLSLIGTGPEVHRRPFGPLYCDVAYIDPAAADARDRLLAEIEGGELALIWFEMIHGSAEGAIPLRLFELIDHHKQAHGYAVGVDEILTGFHRTGRPFCHQGTIHSPDVVTVSKALADGSFPFGATLVSEEVYQRARRRRPELVSWLENLYRNQLGAHIALHCLERLGSGDTARRVERVSEILKAGLSDAAGASPLLHGVEGEGLLLKILYDYSHWTIRALGPAGRELYALYLSRLWLERGKALVFMNRLLPALTMTEEDARLFVKRLEQVFPQDASRHHRGFMAFLGRLVAGQARSLFARRPPRA